MSDINIRAEAKDDFEYLYNFIETSFKTAQVSNGDEQNFVNRLRASSNYIPELALVAENNSRIIGHVMLTHGLINTSNASVKTLILAPLAVDIDYRSKSIGTKLVNTALEKASNMGFKSAFLVGNPAYYSRFGFKKSSDFNIINENSIPNEYVMVKELIKGSLDNISGTILFPT